MKIQITAIVLSTLMSSHVAMAENADEAFSINRESDQYGLAHQLRAGSRTDYFEIADKDGKKKQVRFFLETAAEGETHTLLSLNESIENGTKTSFTRLVNIVQTDEKHPFYYYEIKGLGEELKVPGISETLGYTVNYDTQVSSIVLLDKDKKSYQNTSPHRECFFDHFYRTWS